MARAYVRAGGELHALHQPLRGRLRHRLPPGVADQPRHPLHRPPHCDRRRPLRLRQYRPHRPRPQVLRQGRRDRRGGPSLPFLSLSLFFSFLFFFYFFFLPNSDLT